MGANLCNAAKAGAQNEGSVLDRVISGASTKDLCLLYKLADYKNGGELIEAYNIGGQAEIEKLIRDQFGVLMYNGGKGEIIKRAEYLRWKYRDHEHVVLPIEASLSIYDPLGKWEDHEACWQMQYRGSLGETLLHVLIICDTKVHTRLARTLLKCFPKLAMDVVEGEEYLGASALHLAIAYSNNELVQDLVDAGANIHQRATGSFFLPKDQQRAKPAKSTDYEGLAYLGEYPLAWAACCSNEGVYNLLLDVGANPNDQDSFGNMILHMVVVCDKLDMFGYALRHPKVPARNGIVNNEGLTPLTLACRLGRAEVFKEMLELSAREFWRYSNITCSAYPLNALDTLLPDGRTNWNSAIFIILNGTKEEHLDMLDGGIIQRLLEEKWKTFARVQFMKRLAILALHIICLSGSVYFRPTDVDQPLLGSTEIQNIVRYCFEIGTILGVLSYLIFQQGDEIRNQGFVSFIKQLPSDPAKFIFLISNLLILASIPCRLMGKRETEEKILVFAVPGSWFLLMFFAGAIRLTGPFVTMIYSMITGDMLTFGIIYTVVLFGFSQSFYFLYKGAKQASPLYSSYPSTWMALFQITLGDYSYGDLATTVYPALSKMVFTIFMVLVPILLLNMLIAMMGNTYAHVIEQSEKEWMKQWAKIVVALERAVNQEDCHRYLQEYSISLGPSNDPSREQRGVMVIKSKSKTRAKQRKGAVSNWKRVGKVTIRELHKRGMTGEQLRRLMWGRASISTPTKVPLRPRTDLTDLMGGTAAAAPDLSGDIYGGGRGGGGLMAALDVMAFTNDIDLSSSVPDTEFQLIDKMSANPLSDPTNVSAILDPLRELVIISEKYGNMLDSEQQYELLVLSRAAATVIENAETILPRVCQYGWHSGLGFVDYSHEGLPTDQLPDLAALDPSDSDGLDEGQPLGRGARIKRAKSAKTNRDNISPTSSDQRGLLYHEDSMSSPSEDFGVINYAFVIDEAAANRKRVKTAGVPDAAKPQSLKDAVRPRPRAKTARVNRVAPETSIARKSQSAASTEISAQQPSSPDPLDQWSTKEITNMNTLLAWNDSDEEI